MRYVQRNKAGILVGHYANEQSYAKERVADDHPDIMAWEEKAKLKGAGPDKSLSERISALEAEIAKLRK